MQSAHACRCAPTNDITCHLPFEQLFFNCGITRNDGSESLGCTRRTPHARLMMLSVGGLSDKLERSIW